MTIRTRLTLWYSSLLATVIIVFSISLFGLLNWTWRSQLLENMGRIAITLEQDILIDRVTGTIARQDIPDQLTAMTFAPFGIQIWQADGQLVASTNNVKSIDRPLGTLRFNTTAAMWKEIDLSSYHLLVYSAPVIRNGQLLGSVQLLADLRTLDEATNRLLRVMAGVSFVALVLSFMVGMVIAAQALQPIDTISNAATQITAADDLSKRIPYDGPPDELGQLTATFNATLERLERLFLVQRRFVGDVSHELRTPLTTIQGNLDLIRRYGMDPQSMQDMDSEVKRMTRLVGDLLMLAQADSGRLPLKESPVELASLTVEIFNQTKLLAKEVEFKIGKLMPVLVMGDSDRLKQLMLNLITNAIKYTPEGGTITLSLDSKDGYTLWRVEDTGVGIPAEDLPHIFDRFYRVDKARARQMGGAGLGLSIASWIAEAHKGRIVAESTLNVGSVFTVLLPLIEREKMADSLRETRPRFSSPLLKRPRPEAAPAEPPSLDT